MLLLCIKIFLVRILDVSLGTVRTIMTVKNKNIIASILGMKDLLEASLTLTQYIYYGISMIMAFIFTYIGTIWFKNIVKNGKLIYFVVYCIIVGSLVIIFL